MHRNGSRQAIGSALLSPAQLRQLHEGAMVPRAAPPPGVHKPMSWIVTVQSRGADGSIGTVRVRSAGGEPGPAPKGWTVRVHKRDEQNLLRELHITPKEGD